MEHEVKMKRLNESLILIKAVEAGDVELCSELLRNYPTKRLNKLHRVHLATGEQATFSFLLLAVATGNPQIVETLLAKKVSVDRTGHSERGHVTQTFTPLLRAIEQHDVSIVDVLLKYGADPYTEVRGPKFTEEEGGACRYNNIVYPIEMAIKTRHVAIIELVLRACDPTQLYGSKKHTCLCFAVLELCSAEADPSSLNILIQIMNLGGRLCSGNTDDIGNVFRHSGCVYVNYLVHTALSEASSHMINFRLLQQVCRSDYVRDSSTLYKALRKYSAYSVERLFSGMVNEGRVSGTLTDELCDNTAEMFTWFIEYTRRPSSLKDICRIVIRNTCQPWRKEKGRQLPLPVGLQKFL